MHIILEVQEPSGDIQTKTLFLSQFGFGVKLLCETMNMGVESLSLLVLVRGFGAMPRVGGRFFADWGRASIAFQQTCG